MEAKEIARLDKLKSDHKMIDNQIKELYTKFNDDYTLAKLKKQKLRIKDEINKIERMLKD